MAMSEDGNVENDLGIKSTEEGSCHSLDSNYSQSKLEELKATVETTIDKLVNIDVEVYKELAWDGKVEPLSFDTLKQFTYAIASAAEQTGFDRNMSKEVHHVLLLMCAGNLKMEYKTFTRLLYRFFNIAAQDIAYHKKYSKYFDCLKQLLSGPRIRKSNIEQRTEHEFSAIEREISEVVNTRCDQYIIPVNMLVDLITDDVPFFTNSANRLHRNINNRLKIAHKISRRTSSYYHKVFMEKLNEAYGEVEELMDDVSLARTQKQKAEESLRLGLADLESARIELADTLLKFEALRLENAQTFDSLQDVESALHKALTEKQALQSTLGETVKQVELLGKQKNEVESELNSVSRKLELKQVEKQNVELRLAEVIDQLNAARAEQDSTNAKLLEALAKSELVISGRQQLEQKMHDAVAQLEELRLEKRETMAQLQEVIIDKQNANDTLLNTQEQLKKLQADKLEAEGKLRDAISSSESILTERKDAVEKMEEAIAKLESVRADKQQSVRRLNRELKHTRETVVKLEESSPLNDLLGSNISSQKDKELADKTNRLAKLESRNSDLQRENNSLRKKLTAFELTDTRD